MLIFRANPKRLMFSALALGLVLLFTSFNDSRVSYDSPDTPLTSVSFTSLDDVDWTTKNIEDLQVGDYVLARAEFGSAIEFKRIYETTQRTVDHRLKVNIQSGDETYSLETTVNHPFWVEGKGWTDAVQLLPDDQLSGPDGNFGGLSVISIEYEHVPEGVQVYNCEVTDFHSYFVRTNGARAPPVLVHNYPDDDGSKKRVYHGTDDASAGSINGKGLNKADWEDAAGGAGTDPKGFSVTTDRDTAQAWAEVRAAERGGKPVVLEADPDALPLRPGRPGEWADPDELFIDPDDFPSVGPGTFTPTNG